MEVKHPFTAGFGFIMMQTIETGEVAPPEKQEFSP